VVHDVTDAGSEGDALLPALVRALQRNRSVQDLTLTFLCPWPGQCDLMDDLVRLLSDHNLILRTVVMTDSSSRARRYDTGPIGRVLDENLQFVRTCEAWRAAGRDRTEENLRAELVRWTSRRSPDSLASMTSVFLLLRQNPVPILERLAREKN
jgi:hypothetical protein